MRRLLIVVAVLLVTHSGLSAADLYKVAVNSPQEAARLAAVGGEPILRVSDGFLVLVDPDQKSLLDESGLGVSLIRQGVNRDQLALDNRMDRANVAKYSLVFEEHGVRLFVVDRQVLASQAGDLTPDLRPIPTGGVSLRMEAPTSSAEEMLSSLSITSAPLDSLIGLVSQDTIYSKLLTLQAFGTRVAGTTPNITSRNWIYNQLVSFGYDSVVYDSFTASVSGGTKMCYNVMATKVGVVHPNHYVIVGAHRDAVTSSPGADDNGSGTIAVLEIARVLKNIPTDLTVIFALYDAEEYGLYGSNHHAAEVNAGGDSLVYMLNMDMIAHFQNSADANLYHGTSTEFSQLWMQLADSLVGITGHLAGSSSGSDHFPYSQYGYPVTFAAEYIFSTVYHSARDSSTNMNFEYMTRMVKACLATGYTVAQTAGPKPSLALQLEEAAPVMVNPAGGTSFNVSIASAYGGQLVTGSAKLHYSVDGAEFVETPMVHLVDNIYSAVFPEITCGSDVLYYLSVEEETSGVTTIPDLAHPLLAVAGTSMSVAWSDNGESSLGWTVTGNAVDGQWTRGVPVGNGERGDPKYDYDGSGSCWLTDNVYGNSDVDDGTTYLLSPTLDLSQGNALLTYAVWFSNNFGASPNEDVFKVWISNDNGTVWNQADAVGPVTDAGGGWHLRSFWVGDWIVPSAQVKLRFEAADLGSGSVVEAAIDALTIRRFDCAPPSCCSGETGNLNLSAQETPDLSDLALLITYLTATPQPELPCLEEANVNGSGPSQPDLSDLSLLIAFLTQSPRPTLPVCP